MPASIIKTLAVAALAFSSITLATPVDLSTHALEKRDAWTSSSTCPSGNGEVYTGPSGRQWTVNCGMDTISGATIASSTTNSFIDCINWCGANVASNGCARVTYTGDVGSSGTCYLKPGGSGLKASTGIKVATLK